MAGDGASMMGSGIGAVVGVMGDEWTRQNQRNDNKRYQNRQAVLNEEMAQRNQERAKEMWDYTNFENQVKHLKGANLNTALMYGGSGAGGATTSGGQGSGVGMPTASPVQGGTLMAVQNMKEMALMDAQKANIEADTQNKLADATNKGADTTLKGATTALTNLQSENQKLLTSITADSKEDVLGTIRANYNKAEGEAAQAVAKGRYAEGTAEAEMKKLQQEAVNTILQAEAIKAGVQLTEEQTRRISEELAQGWEELYQKGRANDNQAGMVNIAGFKAKLDEILGKANLDLRAKELMIRGAEAFMNGVKSPNKSKGSTTETFRDKDGTTISNTTHH